MLAGGSDEEAASTNRTSIRLALGQILDYGRYVKKHFEGTELARLLPKRPPEDVVSLLESLGVGCVVETAPGAFVDATSLKRCPS